jgi:hypothetical protein
MNFKVYRFVRYSYMCYCTRAVDWAVACYLSFGRKGGLFGFRVGFGVDVRYNRIYLGRQAGSQPASSVTTVAMRCDLYIIILLELQGLE